MMGRKSDAMAMSLMDGIPPVPSDVVEASEYGDFPEPLPASADATPPTESPLEERWSPFAYDHAADEAESTRLYAIAAGGPSQRKTLPQSAAEAARMSVVRDYHQQISPTDSLYFVMAFIERAGQQIAADLGDQLRLQGDDVVNRINDAGAAVAGSIEAAKSDLLATQQRFDQTAHVLGGRLKSTGDWVLKEIAKDREVVVPLLKQQFVDDLAGEDGELEQVKRQMRKELPEEVRLAIKAAVMKEVTLLQGAMKEATEALSVSAAATKARAKNGWLKNLTDDLKSLADEGRYVTLGAALAVAVFGGYLLAGIVL